MKKFLCSLMILLVALCAGCGNDGQKPVAQNTVEVKKISQDKAMEMLEADPNAKLLDCRFPVDYEKRHIPGAINFPLEAAVAENFEKIPDKNDILITYCGDGNRGGLTAKVLIEKGYKNVYTMGGIIDWTGEVEGTDVEETNDESEDTKDAEAEDTGVKKEDVEDDDEQ